MPALLKYTWRSEVDTGCSCNGHHDAFIASHCAMVLEAVEDGHPTHVSFALAQKPGLEERAGAKPRLDFRLLANSAPMSMPIHVQGGPYVLIAFCCSWVSPCCGNV